MLTLGLLATLEAKPDHIDELQELLTSALALAEREEGTVVWFALRLGPTTFGIFDAFGSDADRRAHLEGRIAATLLAEAPRLLAREPDIRPVDVLAAKVPGRR